MPINRSDRLDRYLSGIPILWRPMTPWSPSPVRSTRMELVRVLVMGILLHGSIGTPSQVCSVLLISRELGDRRQGGCTSDQRRRSSGGEPGKTLTFFAGTAARRGHLEWADHCELKMRCFKSALCNNPKSRLLVSSYSCCSRNWSLQKHWPKT